MNYSLERPQPMVGILGETKPDYLVNYGIQNEGSHIRAHVCVLAGKVYVYPTTEGVRALETTLQKGRTATQPGMDKPTAYGYAIPIEEIERCVPISAKGIIKTARFALDDTTSAKGAKAVKVVAELLRVGWFPLPVDPQIIEDAEMQIKGADINVRASFKIQVKCDYKGGDGPGCTGRLYLQVAEINPFKQT